MLHYVIYFALLMTIQLSVYAEGHHPQKFLDSIKGTQNEAQQIYNHFCVNCHAKKPLIPVGAPRVGELNDWKQRIKQGMDLLFKHTDEGINAMPPRGGCFECTDEQLLQVIYFMLPKTDKKHHLK